MRVAIELRSKLRKPRGAIPHHAAMVWLHLLELDTVLGYAGF